MISLGLIGALIVATTYWQTWAAAGLADRQDNAIKIVAQFSIKRGLIRAADGEILATNRKKDLDDAFLRRLRYVVDFPLPDAAERLRIWRQVLPA